MPSARFRALRRSSSRSRGRARFSIAALVDPTERAEPRRDRNLAAFERTLIVRCQAQKGHRGPWSARSVPPSEFEALEPHRRRRRHLRRLEGALGGAHEGAFGFKFVQDAAQFGLVLDWNVQAARNIALGAMAGVFEYSRGPSRGWVDRFPWKSEEGEVLGSCLCFCRLLGGFGFGRGLLGCGFLGCC